MYVEDVLLLEDPLPNIPICVFVCIRMYLWKKQKIPNKITRSLLFFQLKKTIISLPQVSCRIRAKFKCAEDEADPERFFTGLPGPVPFFSPSFLSI